MIDLPKELKEEYSFEEASRLVTSFGNGDLLDGMETIRDEHQDVVVNDRDEMAHLDCWAHEISAYNVVFFGMSKLFNGE